MRKVTNTSKLLADLLGAMSAGRAVTIRYVKACGEVSRRGIEILSVALTSKNETTVAVLDRRTGERRTFRLDRITHYTCHRVARHAAYRVAPVVPNVATLLDDEDAEVVGFQAWDLAPDSN